MDKLLQIGAGISTPLGLAGFVAALTLLLVRVAIRGNLLPKVSEQASSTALLRIINGLFVLAVMAVLLAGAGSLRAPPPPPPRTIVGTVRTAAGGLADGMLVALAGTNASTRTNQNGYFSLEDPSKPPADSAILLIGDPARAERHDVPLGKPLVINMAEVKPVVETKPLQRADTPALPMTTRVRATRLPQRVAETRAGEKAANAVRATPATLVGTDVRVITPPQLQLADPVADRLRQQGAFVTLTRTTLPNASRECRTVYQSSQEDAARRVQQNIRDLINCPLELADIASASRMILVYLPGRP